VAYAIALLPIIAVRYWPVVMLANEVPSSD
jgi:hypothetical protein